MAEDLEKIDRIKSNLRSYLNAQPTGEHAEQAKRILVNLQANAPSLPSPSSQMKNPTDEELGIEDKPIEGSRFMDMGAQTARAQSAMDAEATMPKSDMAQAHRLTQGEMTDPIVSELGAQAMSMPLLHVAGLGLSKLGRGILETRDASRLGRTAVDVNRGTIIKNGAMAGKTAGEAMDEIARLKSAATHPQQSAWLDAEAEKVLDEASAVTPPDPGASGALGHLAHLAGHGPTGLALRAAAAAPGEAVGVAGRGLIRTGNAVPLLGSPLLQAVSGTERP